MHLLGNIPEKRRTLKRCSAGVVCFALPIAAATALAFGGGAPARHGDNPSHEKGSMSYNIARDCTNFSISQGVIHAECNTTTDANVNPSSTSIHVGDMIVEVDFRLYWVNGQGAPGPGPRVTDECSNLSTFYRDGGVWLRAHCNGLNLEVSINNPDNWGGVWNNGGTLTLK